MARRKRWVGARDSEGNGSQDWKLESEDTVEFAGSLEFWRGAGRDSQGLRLARRRLDRLDRRKLWSMASCFFGGGDWAD